MRTDGQTDRRARSTRLVMLIKNIHTLDRLGSDPDQEYIYFIGSKTLCDPDQEYIYFMWSDTLPSALTYFPII